MSSSKVPNFLAQLFDSIMLRLVFVPASSSVLLRAPPPIFFRSPLAPFATTPMPKSITAPAAADSKTLAASFSAVSGLF